MNCTYFRGQLPALLYGDLCEADAATTRSHLAECSACRQEFAHLERVRDALHRVVTPTVQVDLPGLLRQVAALQARSARRWRRAAAAVGAVAAALLVVVLVRLQVRIEAHQLVVTWGDAPVKEAVPAPDAVARNDKQPEAPEPMVLADLTERVRILDDLLHAFMNDAVQHDQLHKARLTRLEQAAVRNGWRWSETERDVAVMRTALFAIPKRGEKP